MANKKTCYTFVNEDYKFNSFFFVSSSELKLNEMTDPILNTRGEDFIINVIFNSYTDLHSIKSVMRGK